MNQQELTSLTVSRLLSESGFNVPAQYFWCYNRRKNKYELKSENGIGFPAYSEDCLLQVLPPLFRDKALIRRKNGQNKFQVSRNLAFFSWEKEADAIGWYIFLLLKSKQLNIVDVNNPSPRGAAVSLPGS